MFEEVTTEHQKINLAETVNGSQTTEIREAVIVSMKTQEGRGSQEGFHQFGKEAWQKNIGDRSNLVARMLTVGAEKGDYSIWQAVWENLPEADPERTLLSLDAPSRKWLLQLFQDTADAAWGEEKAHKVESEGFKKIGDKWEFDPERLQTDLFSVAETAVGKMQELKLLPEPLAREVKKLQKITTDQARAIELLNQLFEGVAKTIEEWPDNMRLEVVRERLESSPRGINEIFTKALAIAKAKFEAEDVPRLMEQLIKPLPLVEQMAIMMKGKGEFEVEVSGKDIQPLTECFLPDVSLLKALPGTELSITSRKGEKGIGVAVRLGKMAEKRPGESEFEGIMVDFTLNNGHGGLVRSGDIDFETNLPGKTKALLAVLGRMDNRYSLDHIKEEITTRTSFAQKTLNEWLIIEMKKRGVEINSAEIKAEIVDNQRLKLSITRQSAR